MKQFFLILISVLITVCIYADFSVFNGSGHDSSTVSTVDNTVDAGSDQQRNTRKTPQVTAESKRLFLERTTAAVYKVKAKLDAQYRMVYKLSLKKHLTRDERATIERLKKSYNVDGIPCLLKRLHTHPVSIVIAQAALESGWGSSRFYTEANNIFGVWSYDPYEPRMAAGKPRAGKKKVYVKKYKNLEASIESYYRMMAKGRAYKQFRTARLHTDNPFEIIPYLDHYSELRHEYVKRLYFVIKSNSFYQLDATVYQPPGWHKIKPAKAEYPVPKKEEPAAMVADKCKKKEDDNVTDVIFAKERDRSSAPDIAKISAETAR